jgi:ADP-ribose pyrophosphatase YjhB (NUDIX family)
MNYCNNCGKELEVRQENIEWFCPNCNRHTYSNPIPTIDALLFDENGRILLGKRRHEPFKGKLNLPGGFVDLNETLEQAIARELKEELGLEPTDYSQLSYGGSRIKPEDLTTKNEYDHVMRAVALKQARMH